MRDYTTDKNAMALLAMILQDPNIRRAAYVYHDETIELDETRAASEQLGDLIKQYFDQDHGAWCTWDHAANALYSTAEEQGFIKGWAMAASLLLPLLPTVDDI